MSSSIVAPQDRYGRVGDNRRNVSNEIFKFGSNLAFTKDTDRFQKIDSAQAERYRQLEERQKRLERDEFRRNWKSDIERSRWQKMSTDYHIQQECLKAKQIKARIGKNSVSYNPITLEYHNDSNGASLAREDAKAMLRTSIRSLNLYHKNNSFDPMRCEDVPRNPSEIIGVTDTKEKEISTPAAKSGSHTLTPPKFGRRSHHPVLSPNNASLDIPKALLNYTNANAELLKRRQGDSANDINSYLKFDNGRWARHY